MGCGHRGTAWGKWLQALGVVIDEVFFCFFFSFFIQGLADESEFIRETALQAGQTIVHKYADTAVEVFLPQLENGLFNENWRIR